MPSSAEQRHFDGNLEFSYSQGQKYALTEPWNWVWIRAINRADRGALSGTRQANFDVSQFCIQLHMRATHLCRFTSSPGRKRTSGIVYSSFELTPVRQAPIFDSHHSCSDPELPPPRSDIRADRAIATMVDCRCGPEVPVRLHDPNQCALVAFVHRFAPTDWVAEGESRDKFSKTRWTCPGSCLDRDPKQAFTLARQVGSNADEAAF